MLRKIFELEDKKLEVLEEFHEPSQNFVTQDQIIERCTDPNFILYAVKAYDLFSETAEKLVIETKVCIA